MTWEPGDQIQTVRYERTVEIVYEGDPPPLPPPTDPQTMRRRLALMLERRRDLHDEASLPLALEIVRGVLSGEWVVTDHFEGDDRRFVIVQRGQAGDGRALSERERQVLAFAIRGHSNKFVAFELGLTPSTVATHLRRAMSKLRVESREALIQALPFEEEE
jgi:DNA-binding NarL/FixJ family response regulator